MKLNEINSFFFFIPGSAFQIFIVVEILYCVLTCVLVCVLILLCFNFSGHSFIADESNLVAKYDNALGLQYSPHYWFKGSLDSESLLV